MRAKLVTGLPRDLSRRVQYDLSLLRTPRSIYQLELELFRMTEMARFWLVENGISPYKLALQAGVSTSQTHKALKDDWNPSHRLLARISHSLPEAWVAKFEQDCDFALPGSMQHAQPYDHMPRISKAVRQAKDCQTIEEFCSFLEENDFSYFILSRVDGKLKYQRMILLDENLRRIVESKGFIAPFFRPSIKQHYLSDEINVGRFRHPIILDDEFFCLSYWLVRLNAFGEKFSVISKIDIAHAENVRQENIMERFYTVFLPKLVDLG